MSTERVEGVKFPLRQRLCARCEHGKFFVYVFEKEAGQYKDFELWICCKCGFVEIIIPEQDVESD